MKKILLFLFSVFSFFSFTAVSQQWSKVSSAVLNNDIHSIMVYDDKLFINGYFTKIGNLDARGIASWNGINWTSYGQVMNEYDEIYNYTVIRDTLYIGGSININRVGYSWKVVVYDGVQWQGMPGTEVPSTTSSCKVIFYKNQLYAGGSFTEIGTINVNRIAKWDGSNWSQVSGGVTGGFERIECMAVYKNELYVGGNFYMAGNKVTWYIARWNGSDWNPVGAGLGDGNGARSMVVDSIKNVLYVSGDYFDASGVEAFGIAQWDGNKWSQVGKDTLFGIIDMVMYHGDLYAGTGGYWTFLNGEIANNICRWDGTDWHSIGQGVNSTVFSLAVFHDSLFVGGAFTKVGNNLSAPYLAKWYSPDAYADTCGYNSSYCPKPQAGFSADSIHGFSYLFNNATAGSCTFKWYFGDGDSSTAFSPTHIYQDTGEYQVTLIAYAGLRSDTVSQPVIIYYTIGMNELSPQSNKFEIIPNPSGQTVLFKYRIPSIGSATLKITTLSGEILKSYSLETSKTYLEISTTEFGQGLYLCKLVNDKGRVLQYKKLVVMR